MLHGLVLVLSSGVRAGIEAANIQSPGMRPQAVNMVSIYSIYPRT
jgi:hypothetical protein